jgi:hypothetical protein
VLIAVNKEFGRRVADAIEEDCKWEETDLLELAAELEKMCE